MICHQSHQLQIRDLDPKVLGHELQHLNLDVSVVCMQVDQHQPLNDQCFGRHQLIFEHALSC